MSDAIRLSEDVALGWQMPLDNPHQEIITMVNADQPAGEPVPATVVTLPVLAPEPASVATMTTPRPVPTILRLEPEPRIAELERQNADRDRRIPDLERDLKPRATRRCSIVSNWGE